MPIYEYRCDNCGAKQDEFRRMDDRHRAIQCGCGGELRFQISRPMIQCDDAVNVPWLRDFSRHHKKPHIESRGDYRQYLRENDLRPADGENLSEV